MAIVRGLFETHLPVRDVARSVAFYRDIVGLSLAYDLPERNAAFLWIGGPGRGILGLWGTGSSPLSMTLHIAFDVPGENLRAPVTRLGNRAERVVNLRELEHPHRHRPQRAG